MFTNLILTVFLLSVYDNIVDIYNPTITDYQIVQEYLSSDNRPNLELIKDTPHNGTKHYTQAKNFKIIGETPEEYPRAGMYAINCSEAQRENCIIIYGSFNKGFPKGVERFVELIKNSDYKGHLLYKIGGWPNVEEGDLALAHVPLSFKVCFFREAKRLGYKKVFWLDSSIVPLVSLNKIFNMIQAKGYFIMGNCHKVGPYFNEFAANAFGLSLKQTYSIPSCSAGIFGVDFENSLGEEIIEKYYQAAVHENGFYNPRIEQSALSVILYQLGIQDFVSYSKIVHRQKDIKRKPNAYFWVNREYVK